MNAFTAHKRIIRNGAEYHAHDCPACLRWHTRWKTWA